MVGIALEALQTPQNEVRSDNEDLTNVFSPGEIAVEQESVESVESVEDTFPDGGWKAYSVVIGSFLGLLTTFGMLNSIGAIQAYISTHQLADVKASTISWIFSIYTSFCFAFGVFVGPYFDRKGSFKLLTLGTIIIFGGFMALANCTELYQFILSLSICIALGSAMCITPLVGVISHWFYYRRGSATGIATIGGSVGGMVIPLMLRSLYLSVGYVWAVRILGFFSLGCLSLSIFLAKERIVKREPADKVKKSRGVRILGMLKKLKDLKYTFMIAGVFLAELSLVLLTTYYSTYAISRGMSESSSYLLLTIFNGCGIAGRFVPGFLSDSYGPYNLMVGMLIGVTLSMFLLWLPFGSSFKVLYAFAAVSGFFTSSILTLTPVCLSTITTVDQFGAKYGLLYSFVSIADLFGIPLGALVIGNGSKHEYDMFALLCSILSLVGTSFWYASRYRIVGFKLNVKV